MSDWVILRTKGRDTLELAEKLARAKFMVWTPTHVERKHSPHNRLGVEIAAPLLPTFAFARARHLHSLLAMSGAPRKACPDFSVFHYMDQIPLIADNELDALRQVEERERLNSLRRKPRARKFDSGDEIRIDQGAFAGMSGIVEQDDGKFAMVLFGRTAVKIATFMLEPRAAA